MIWVVYLSLHAFLYLSSSPLGITLSYVVSQIKNGPLHLSMKMVQTESGSSLWLGHPVSLGQTITLLVGEDMADFSWDGFLHEQNLHGWIFCLMQIYGVTLSPKSALLFNSLRINKTILKNPVPKMVRFLSSLKTYISPVVFTLVFVNK